MSFSLQDHHYMARAIRLAERGLYTTDPNPRVGCLIVRDHEVVGQGWHRKAGEAHAERIALTEAGNKARGATAYITLEPCCHQGRTPPCTSALLEAGISRVVAAMMDPNPLVAGQGLALLQQHGIKTEVGLLTDEAKKLNPGFIQRMEKGLPWVRCKLAMSLDGRTAMANGESQWITGESARQDVHRWRARSSVILTGIGTVLADDPSLTVRLPLDALYGVEAPAYFRQPIRAVMDHHLRCPPQARMLSLPGQTWILHSCPDRNKQQALQAAGAQLFYFEDLRIETVLRFLAQRECNELLVEAGPTLAAAFLQSGYLNELIVYMAPHIMGDQARGLFKLPLQSMSERIHLRLLSQRQVGEDLRLILEVKN